MNYCCAPLVQALEAAKVSHYYCDEDSWHSCPLAPEGCANTEFPADICNCGADEHNARIDAALAEHAKNA